MHLLTVHLALARLKCTDVTHNLPAIIQIPLQLTAACHTSKCNLAMSTGWLYYTSY